MERKDLYEQCNRIRILENRTSRSRMIDALQILFPFLGGEKLL